MCGLLSGKVCLIAGATSEMGEATALTFAKNGAELFLTGRREERLEQVREVCNAAGAKVVTLVKDMDEKGAAKEVVGEALKEFGRIDVAVSYVGYPFRLDYWFKELHELELTALEEVIKTDLFVSFELAGSLIPVMRRQGGGVIIFTSSTPAVSWHYNGAVYSIAKAGVISLVKSIAAENGRYGIRAYALAPGNIKTKATYEALSEEERKRLAEESPSKRWGSPDEVASVALALASGMFSFVNGQTIVIDGGTVMLP